MARGSAAGEYEPLFCRLTVSAIRAFVRRAAVAALPRSSQATQAAICPSVRLAASVPAPRPARLSTAAAADYDASARVLAAL
jgi:hypothetical protein